MLEETDLEAEEISLFVLHQANLRIIEAVAKRLKQPMEKFPVNLTECGNISAASVPILLDNINRHGMIHRGDKVVPLVSAADSHGAQRYWSGKRR